jgi:glycosyltransferase involved in cell wall biosynthesis
MTSEGNVGQKGRWFTALLLPYSEHSGFWGRDAALFHEGFRSCGIDARYVALGEDRIDDSRGLLLAPQHKMENAAWWKQWELKGVVLYSWALPKFEPVARAIKNAGIRLVIILDTEAIMSPKVWPSMYVRLMWLTEREARKPLPLARALIKTVVASFGWRYRGMTKHLECADLLVLPSPLARERYARFLSGLGRTDLISRLKFIPYPISAGMTYAGSQSKRKLLIAVGRWERLQKNPVLLIRALGKVLAQSPDYSARIVGSAEDYLRQLISRWTPRYAERIELT